jgi:hypothetical protein
MNDLSTDNDLLTSSEPTSTELAREFVGAAFNFKGESLRPYTAGTDLLFTQVLDRNDATRTAVLGFIFIHRPHWAKSGPDGREKLMGLCWDKMKFRGALLDWIDSINLTAEDYAEADKIFLAMRDGARKTSVEVVQDGTEKKTKVRRRQTSRS